MVASQIPHMTYRQYRTARRLVHECCNYDYGNCLLLDNGEECICPQSITYSLVCHWFRAAVLPLDAGLCAALVPPPAGRQQRRCMDCAQRSLWVLPLHNIPRQSHLVRHMPGKGVLDLVVLQQPALNGIHQQHPARTQAGLPHDFFRRDLQHAHFGTKSRQFRNFWVPLTWRGAL